MSAYIFDDESYERWLTYCDALLELMDYRNCLECERVPLDERATVYPIAAGYAP